MAVAGGRAWVPLTKAGIRDIRHAYYIDLPSPGVQFNLGTASATADRYDLVVARVSDDTDVTTYAEVALANYAPGNMAPGWAVDVVRGTDGAGAPSVPYDSYLVLAKVRVKKGATSLSAADIEDMRYTTTGQGDPTALTPLRTASGQSVAAVAANQSRGGLIYSSDEDRLYIKGSTDAKPLVNRAMVTGQTGRGSTGWWGVETPSGGNGKMLWFDGPATAFDRIGIINYQMRVTAPPDREGWHSVQIFSDNTNYWENLRKYEKSNLGITPHWGSAHVIIPKNKPLNVVLYLYAQGGWAYLDEWQSYAQMTVIPAE